MLIMLRGVVVLEVRFTEDHRIISPYLCKLGNSVRGRLLRDAGWRPVLNRLRA
jgi:hypothetical protein